MKTQAELIREALGVLGRDAPAKAIVDSIGPVDRAGKRKPSLIPLEYIEVVRKKYRPKKTSPAREQPPANPKNPLYWNWHGEIVLKIEDLTPETWDMLSRFVAAMKPPE